MLRKMVGKGFCALACVAALAACDKDSDSTASTLGQEEFNPPGNLISVTGDGNVELWWTAANVEDEFKGFYVFAAKAAGVPNPAFPAGVTLPSKSGVPFCDKNSAFWQKFGFSESKSDCEGKADGKQDDEEAAMALADDEEETETKPSTFSVCTGKGTATTTSYDTTEGVGAFNCTITKDVAGDDLKNGEKYYFFVVAVQGDDLRQISWTSNVITDTPAKKAFPAANADPEMVVGQEKSLPIEFDMTAWTATPGTETACGTEARCTLTKQNAAGPVGTKPTIWLSRDVSGNKHRIFLSTSSAAHDGWTVQVQARGPQIKANDATGVVEHYGRPGDEAAAGSTFLAAGKQVAVYNNQVFDLKFTKGTTIHYGKLVVGAIAYAGDAPATSGNATIQAWIIMQPGVNNPHYFW